MNYRVLIVDDELPALDTLRRIIDWENLGFQIAGIARNGRDALQLYMQIEPELVITDIQMPIMDGLELMRQIKQIKPNQQIVVLSCHENFYYAKEAMKLGVTDYLLKDLLTADELRWMLQNLKLEVNLENQRPVETSSLEVCALPLQRYFNAVACFGIMGSVKMNQGLAAALQRQHGINIGNTHFICLAVQIDDYSRYRGSLSANEEQEKNNRLICLLYESLDALWGGEVIQVDQGCFQLIAGIETVTSDLKTLTDSHFICQRIRSILHQVENISVTIGVSRSFRNILLFANYMDEAKKSVQTRLFYGKGKNILYNTITTPIQGKEFPHFDIQFKSLISAVTDEDMVRISRLLYELYHLDINGFPQYNYVKQLNLSLIRMIMEKAIEKKRPFEELFDCNYIPIEELEKYETIAEMCQWMSDRFSRLFKEATPPVYSKHVTGAIRFIQMHFTKDIGLEAVSEHLHIHKGYLCRIFKQETGMNITDFLLQTRIDKAKQLIETTNLKLYEISGQVGFSTPQQFSLVFKKITGVSPTKYGSS